MDDGVATPHGLFKLIVFAHIGLHMRDRAGAAIRGNRCLIDADDGMPLRKRKLGGHAPNPPAPARDCNLHA